MIIAECCSNHGGDMKLAREMILSAKKNGADLVKFQLYDAEDDKGKSYYEWVKKAELSFEQAKMLFDYGMEVGIEVFFSVFHVLQVQWCESIGVKRYKLAAGQWNAKKVTFDAIMNTHKPILCSFHNQSPFVKLSKGSLNGMLWCPMGYPSNTNYINHIDFTSGYWQGFSDHVIGLDASKIALARGAQIIEKHFILDDRENSQSPEREWSMTPDELKELKRWEAVCRKVLG